MQRLILNLHYSYIPTCTLCWVQCPGSNDDDFDCFKGEDAEGFSVGPSITLLPLLLSMEDDHGGLYRQGLPFHGRVSRYELNFEI